MASNADVEAFRATVVRPALTRLAPFVPWSIAAENLLLGTALVESALVYRRQHGGGPALGLFQMEPATHRDIWANYLAYRTLLADRVRKIAGVVGQPPATLVVEHDVYAAVMARLLYWRFPDRLPAADDAAGMAALWKRRFNTRLGAGRTDKFERLFRTRVLGET